LHTRAVVQALGSRRRRWDNFKMNLKVTQYEGVDAVHLAEWRGH